MSDLFNQQQPEILATIKRPLADLMRPTSFDFVVGQERLIRTKYYFKPNDKSELFGFIYSMGASWSR